MGFAMIPDDGRPPRLFRFVDLPDNKLAVLDHAKNLLRIDKRSFDCLPNVEQGQVLATHHDLYVADNGRGVSIAHSPFAPR